MPHYQNKSHEELRFQDYELHKGKMFVLSQILSEVHNYLELEVIFFNLLFVNQDSTYQQNLGVLLELNVEVVENHRILKHQVMESIRGTPLE